MHGRGQHAGGRRAESLVVPRAQVDSYYGRPIIKQTVWGSPQIPGYFFLGGLAGAVLAGRSRLGTVVSGAALTRFGVFEAGRTSARDPKYIVGPQRVRLAARAAAEQSTAGGRA